MKPGTISRFLFPVIWIIIYAPCGFAQSNSDQTSRYYEDALSLYHKDEIKEAIIQLKNALQQQPDYLAAHLLLGKSYLRQRNNAAAEAELRKAAKLGADPALVVIPLAQALFRQNRAATILEEINPDQFHGPVKSKILVQHGHALVKLGRIEEGLTVYKEAASIDPSIPAPLIGQATVLLSRGETDQSLDLAEKAKALDPENADTWLLLASISHSLGNFQQALDQYTKVIQLAPDNVEVQIILSGVLLDLDRNEEAVEQLQQLRGLYPYDPRPAYLLAVALNRLGRNEDAVKELQAAEDIFAKINPEILLNNLQTLFLSGLVSYSLNHFEKAAELLKQTIRLNPGHPGARKLLGSILVKQNQFDQAIQIMAPVLTEATHDEQLLTMLGTAYMHQRQYEKATELLEKALVLNAENKGAHTNLAISHLAVGEEKLGMAALSTIVKGDPAQSKAALVLATRHLKHSDYSRAIEVIEKLLKTQPGNLTAINLLGFAHVSAGQKTQARNAFEKAIELDTKFLPAQINLARLDLLIGKIGNARKRLNGILQKDPNTTKVMIELANLEITQKQFSEAIRWLKKAHSFKPRSVAVILRLADLYLVTGEPDKALALTTGGEIWAPRNLDLLEMQGRALIASGNIKIAKVIFQRMTQYAEFKSRRLFRIARYQNELSDIGESIWSLQKAVKGDPDFASARIALVEMLMKANRMVEALEQVEELKKRFPEKPDADRLAGDISLHQGDYATAIKHYRRALKEQEIPLVAIQLFRAQRLAGDDEKAMTFLRDWIKESPTDNLARLALAEAYLEDGNVKMATSTFERILEAQPDNPRILNNLAYLYHKQDNPNAIPMAERAYAIAPDNPSVNDTLGWLLVQDGETEKGLKFLRHAHTRASNDPEIRFHIAVALDRLGQTDQAKMQLEEAIALKSRFDGLEQAEKLLKKLKKE